MIELLAFKKYYGSHLALDVPALRLEPGVHWVKGGNGSGKTTLFRTLAGLLPFAGEVIIDDTLNLRQHPVACRRIINYGEAEPLFPPFVSGQDLIRLFAESKQAPADQVRLVTEALGVDSFARQSTGTYSSGMRKKLSLVLAFLGQPRVILLDEPLVTLDVASVERVCALLADYRARGVTFLVSSHQVFEEEKLAFTSTLTVAHQTVTVTPTADFPTQ